MRNLRNNMFILVAIILLNNPLGAKMIHVKDELFIKTKHEHNHSCAAKVELSKREIQRAARKRLWMLAQNRNITDSWLEVPIMSTNKKKFGYLVEWVVHLQNLSIEDKKKQNIYIFVNLYGHVTGVNYIGK